MSPMIAIAIAMSPPAPIPCTARNAISCAMFCDSPDSSDPIRKIVIAVWNTILRPSRSLIFP